MELVYIFRLLYRRRWIIIGTTLVAMIAAFLFSMREKKMFKSMAQISTGYTVSEELRLTDGTFNISQIDVNFNNAIENFTSPKVLSLLTYQLILHDLTQPQKSFRYPDPKDPKAQAISREAAIKLFQQKYDSIVVLNPGIPQEKTLVNLLEAYEYDIASINAQLYVARHLRTDFIDIYYRSENPELSAFVVNSIFREYQRYSEAFKRERSIESMVALDSLVKKKKQEMDEKIGLRATFINDSISKIDPNVLGASQLSQISQFEAYLADEQARQQNLSHQISQLQKQINERAGAVPGGNRDEDNSEYFALRRQYNSLLDQYVQGGSSDQELRKRLDDIQVRMKEKAPSAANSSADPGAASSQLATLQQQKSNAEGDLQSARTKIAFYNSKLAELRGALRRVAPNSSSSLGRYDNEVELVIAEYNSAKEKFNLASNMNEGASSTFKQTLYGQPALSPEPSKKLLVTALAGASGFLVTSLVFIFLGFIDQSIKTPSQFQRQTGLKLLGVVNMINMSNSPLADQVTHIELHDAHRDNSFRELLRKLRFEIENSGKRIILFTSTEPQQGKTTLVQALAFSLNLGKKKVLIIDTNFCNNDLTLQSKAVPTLEQFSGNGQLKQEDVLSLVTSTAVEHVDIIGCQGGDYTPSEILPKNHLLKYLPDLLKTYDFIFMEAAPLNGFTDTKELVEYADGIVAIFSAKAEIKATDKESINYLAELDNKFIGAILNKVEKPDIML